MKTITLVFTIAAAAAVTGCGQQESSVDQWSDQDTAVCTDKSGVRVPDSNCQPLIHGSAGSSVGSAFMWYFIGRSMAMPYYGDRVRGGSFTPSPGVRYAAAPASMAMTRSAAVSRGGFGSRARSSGFRVSG